MKKKITLLLALLSLIESKPLYCAYAEAPPEIYHSLHEDGALMIAPTPYGESIELFNTTLAPLGKKRTVKDLMEAAHDLGHPFCFLFCTTPENLPAVVLLDSNLHLLVKEDLLSNLTPQCKYTLYPGTKGTYCSPFFTMPQPQPSVVVQPIPYPVEVSRPYPVHVRVEVPVGIPTPYPVHTPYAVPGPVRYINIKETIHHYVKPPLTTPSPLINATPPSSTPAIAASPHTKNPINAGLNELLTRLQSQGDTPAPSLSLSSLPIVPALVLPENLISSPEPIALPTPHEEEQKALAALQEAEARKQEAARIAAEEEQRLLMAAEQAARIAAEEEEQRIFIAAEQAAQKTKQEEEQKALAAAHEVQAREQETATKAAQEAAQIAAEKLTQIQKITKKELQTQKKLQGDRDRKAAQEAAAAQKKAQDEIAEKQKLSQAQKEREVAAQQKAEKAVADKKKADKKAADKKKEEKENKLLSRAAAAAANPLSQTPPIPSLSFEERFEDHKKQLCSLLEKESYEEAKKISKAFLREAAPHQVESIFKETTTALSLAYSYEAFCLLHAEHPWEPELLTSITRFVVETLPSLRLSCVNSRIALTTINYLTEILKLSQKHTLSFSTAPFSFLDTDSTSVSFKETCARLATEKTTYLIHTSANAPESFKPLQNALQKLFKMACSPEELLFAVQTTNTNKRTWISLQELMNFLKANPSITFPPDELKSLLSQAITEIKESTHQVDLLLDHISPTPLTLHTSCSPYDDYLSQVLRSFTSHLENLSLLTCGGAAAANLEK
jgi:hypothetical protein